MSKETQLRAARARQLAKLGWARVEGEQPAEAITYLQMALALAPKDKQSWTALGMAHHRLLQTEEALAAFANSLKLDSGQIDVWAAVGELSLERLDYKAAAQALGECLKLDPQAQHPCGVRARALIRKAQKHLAKQRGDA